MSSFNCEKCGTAILEDNNGYYYIFCEHYPLEKEDNGNNKYPKLLDNMWEESEKSIADIMRTLG